MRVPLFALLAFLGCTLTAVAQPPSARLRNETESNRTRKRLTEVQQKLADGKPVADELQDILDQSGDDLVLVKDNQYQPARRLVQQYLAALPDKQLETFRDRIDEPAKRLLDQGKKRRDPRPLRELAERYFVSRPAEEGLLLLGELAFERGDFVAAVRHWRALLPDADEGALTYPKPKIDPAAVKARLILAKSLGGDRDGAMLDLEQLRKEHPKATGLLAGTTGLYADTLAKLVAAPPLPPLASGGWTSFAGGPARDGKPDSPLPRFLAGERPHRRVAIPRDPTDRGGKDRPSVSVPPAKALVFHPVVVNRMAYLADAGRVIQFDLVAGTARVAFHAAALELDFDATDLALPCPHDADFTLSAANGELFARFGKPALPTNSDTVRPRTLIACLEPKEGGEFPLSAKWSAAPPAGKDTPAAWEGAPVVADGRVYASFVRADNNRLVHAIACYSAGGGPPLWVTDVLDADPRPAIRHRHELLTLAGGNVVYCSHSGLTVAVNAATGKLAWAFRNPPADRPPVVPFRDLCPAVYADGRVFVAPADGDGVFALDADTGRKLWATVAPVYPEQLLGVARGRLVVTTHATRISAAVVAQGGVRGYDAATGVDKPPLGWQNHDDPILNGYGRGVAADNLVFWPTPAGTMMLDPATGRRARPTNTRLPGNVAVADGFLVVATATELWWYRFDGDVMEPPPPPPPVVGVKDPPPFDPKPRVTVAAPGFTLPAPAVEKKAVELPPLARPLVPLQPERDRPVLLCDGQTLFAHSPDDGKKLWQTKLGVSTPLEQVAFTAGRLFAWGRMGVVAAELVAGTIAWEFRPAEGEFSAVTFLGNRLVAKLGERGIIALDLNTGKVAWARSAADENTLYPYSIDAAPKFGPHLVAVGERVFVQREGECWALDVATGVRRERFGTTVQEWTSPPAVRDSRPLVPTPQGLAEWTEQVAVEVFDAGREASRTGAPTAARAFDQTLLAVVPRNIGDELHLLGSGRNPTPKLLPAGVDLSLADADDDRLYVPADGKLFGLNKATLRENWRLTLPDVGAVKWRVTAGRTTLVVCPTEAVPVERWDAAEAVTKLATRPTPLRLIGTGLGAVDAATRFTLPVLILEPGTGKQLQRLDVSVGGPAVAVLPRPDGVLVAGTGRAVWLGKE